jgi:hypothetical protein
MIFIKLYRFLYFAYTFSLLKPCPTSFAIEKEKGITTCKLAYNKFYLVFFCKMDFIFAVDQI